MRRKSAPESAGTVRTATAAEVPALDHALKTAALALADHVDVIAGLEHVGTDRVAGVDVEREVTKFLDAANRGDGASVPSLAVGQAGLALDGAARRTRRVVFLAVVRLEMAALGQAQPLFLLPVEAKLNGLVAVPVGGLALQHLVGASLHDGDAHGSAVLGVNPCLAQFFS